VHGNDQYWQSILDFHLSGHIAAISQPNRT